MKVNIAIPTLIILIVSGFFSFGQIQITVVDSITNESVPFVHATIFGGATIAISDYNGVLNIPLNNLVSKNSKITLILNHIAYKRAIININDNTASIVVEMVRGEFLLDPVTIEYNEKHVQDILILKGFFRSYQLENNILKFYSDGFVEYNVPLDGKNKLLKNNIIEHRTFWNEKLVKQDKTRSFDLRIDSFGPPFLYGYSTIENLNSKFSIVDKGEKTFDIVDSNISIGRILFDDSLNIMNLDVDIDFPNKDKVRKAFGYSLIYEKSISSEVYMPALKQPLKNNYEQLYRKSDYRKILFKHKSEKDYRTIEIVQEFYIEERYYLTKSELASIELNQYDQIKYSSSDQENYTKRVSKLNIPKLPDMITISLNKELSKIEPDTECFTCDN